MAPAPAPTKITAANRYDSVFLIYSPLSSGRGSVIRLADIRPIAYHSIIRIASTLGTNMTAKITATPVGICKFLAITPATFITLARYSVTNHLDFLGVQHDWSPRFPPHPVAGELFPLTVDRIHVQHLTHLDSVGGIGCRERGSNHPNLHVANSSRGILFPRRLRFRCCSIYQSNASRSGFSPCSIHMSRNNSNGKPLVCHR